jgi:hypothetical protein
VVSVVERARHNQLAATGYTSHAQSIQVLG